MQISTILKQTIPSILFCTIVFQTYIAYTHSTGAQASCTNAPSESTCAQSGCHTDKNGGQKNLFTKSGDVTLSNGKGTLTYVPGATYTMKLTCSRKGHKKFGFQVTALSSSGSKMAGTLSVTNSTTTQSITGIVSSASRTYIEQTNSGTSGTNTISWSFKWVAPKPAVGNVIFYGICNASNNDGTSSGDTILAQTFTFVPDTALPVAKFSFTPTNPCAGDTVHFSDSSSGSPTSWSWTFENGSPSTSTSQNPSVVFAAGGTDSVTLSATNAVGTSNAVKQNITINPRSGDTILVKGNDTICSGSAVSLVAPFGLSYKWSTGDTTQTITAISTGTYTVDVSNGYCITKSLPVDITVLQKPVVIVTKSKDTACSGDSITFTATSGFSAYTFYKNGQKVQLGVSNTYTTGNIQQNDSFSATASNSFGCQSDMSAKVNVALPNLPLAPKPSCNLVTDSSITFSWPRLANCNSYQVSTDSGKNWITLKAGNTDTSYTVSGLSYDTYVDLYVRGYNHSKCSYGPIGQALCKTISCSNITYGLKYDSAICTGGLVSLHFSNISIPHYSISINGSKPLKDTFFQVAPDANSQIQISIKDSSSICPPQKDLLAIDVHKIIKMQLQCNSIDSTYCFGGNALLTATNGFDQYAWYESINGNNFKRILQSYNVNKIDISSLAQSGIYIFKIVGTNNYGCGSDSAFKEIISQAPPTPLFRYMSNGLTFTFKDSSADYSRIWYFGDGDTGINMIQTHTYTLPDKYKVTLKTFSSAGCSDTLSEFVDAKLKSGIETYDPVQDVNIYPNPSHSSFSVSFSSALEGTAYIKVVNMNGQDVYSDQIKLEQGQNTLQIELSNSPQGFYFMQLITSDGVNTFKLIKD